MEKTSIEKPWRCGGCGVWVSIQESLCPSCSVQLLKGRMAWTDDVYRTISNNSTVEVTDEN